MVDVATTNEFVVVTTEAMVVLATVMAVLVATRIAGEVTFELIVQSILVRMPGGKMAEEHNLGAIRLGVVPVSVEDLRRGY